MPLDEPQSTLYISLISGDLGLRSHLPRQSRTPIFVSLTVWDCWKLWWILCLLVSTFCPIPSFSFYAPNWQISWMWPENIVHVSRSVMPDSATPWGVAHQAPPSMGLSRQEYWSGLPFLLQGTFLTQWSNPGLLHCRWILYQLSYQGSPENIGFILIISLLLGSWLLKSWIFWLPSMSYKKNVYFVFLYGFSRSFQQETWSAVSYFIIVRSRISFL